MPKSIKSITLLILAIIASLFYSDLQAQYASSSPYSGFGLGDIQLPALSRNFAMGSVGVGISDPYSLNRNNPASFADVWRFTVDIAGYYQITNLETNEKSDKLRNGGIQGLSIALKKSKPITFFVGLSPYSVIGYQFVSPNQIQYDTVKTSYYSSRTGDGGLNDAYGGIAAQFLRSKLNVGICFRYIFGNISSNWITQYPGNYAISLKSKNQIKGIGSQIGIQYADSLKFIGLNTRFRIGAVLDHPFSFRSDQLTTVTSVVSNTYNDPFTVTDTINNVKNKSIKLPTGYGIGFSIFKENNYTFAIDYYRQNWENFDFNNSNAKLTSEHRLNLGIEWIPDFYSYKNFFKRLALRAGAYWHNSYLTVNDKKIDKYALSFGLGIPISARNPSRINIGVEYSIRGKKSNDLIFENSTKFILGLSFIEPWLNPARYD